MVFFLGIETRIEAALSRSPKAQVFQALVWDACAFVIIWGFIGAAARVASGSRPDSFISISH
ncbi:hypothetical protein [Halobacillus salinus]|uniref:Uncharacterized protein n=1 Tax=Halobacillus salinus TaxID=192814 RepID=A0A4Z0GXA3_9BACI|nr:hypothetical protein [Halobacillus salinus]TGB01279.1 hypothetical protein E4663_17550 [Halobacillus salinus]